MSWQGIELVSHAYCVRLAHSLHSVSQSVFVTIALCWYTIVPYPNPFKANTQITHIKNTFTLKTSYSKSKSSFLLQKQPWLATSYCGSAEKKNDRDQFSSERETVKKSSFPAAANNSYSILRCCDKGSKNQLTPISMLLDSMFHLKMPSALKHISSSCLVL